ncbi:DUF523 domain-containing protein [Cytobacillus purgationiresistens]|uniref:Uncharacterized protein YbbK (DUF523 family) n=1 Tax=Cytobacillus purgationiresistens TaxID=863449 RepID=A0ABU0AM52_9BACI|nr:DUF523 domain-containing protein [Cytobacillus purgationiresistens]MDQ0272312.1 uncharacterized protein YbbK (DUF523 family) [Cytobacillus purgationiresistens]
MILVSSCLAGEKVRYDGTDCLQGLIGKWVSEDKARSICPELMGGFSTPRDPAEIRGGDGYDVLNGEAQVFDYSGNNVTDLYMKGANATLDMAKKMNATIIVLKENSPSCGSSHIYNGAFTGAKMVGVGVTTALLRRNGIRVISEEEIQKELVTNSCSKDFSL